jgi:hypothetical protein
MKELCSQLWEVLVPVADNDGNEFAVEYHQEWDSSVRDVTGGLTILRTARGQWHDSEGRLFAEKVIPVRIACDEEKVREIMYLTLKHYGQIAVMAYQVSDRALILEAQA